MAGGRVLALRDIVGRVEKGEYIYYCRLGEAFEPEALTC
jgi:hypothetical protein